MKTIEIMQLLSIVAMSAFLLGHMVFMISKSLKSLCKKEGSNIWFIISCGTDPSKGENSWRNYEILKNKEPFSFSGDGLFYTEKQKKLNLKIYFAIGFIIVTLLSISSLWYLFFGILLIFPIITLGIIQLLAGILEVIVFILYLFFSQYLPNLIKSICN